MLDYSSNNKRIAANSIFLSIRMVIVLCLTFYTTRKMLEILGAMDYGVYNVVCGFVAMFAFLNTSMSNSIQRFYNYEYGKNGEQGANNVYCTAILIQFLLAIIIIILTESFGLWYIHNKMVIPYDRLIAAEWIFQFSIFSFLFVIIQAPYSAAVMAHERMGFFAIVNVLDAILKLAIVLILPYLNNDQLIMYGVLVAIISVFNFLIYYIYCKKNFVEIKTRRFFDKHLFFSMLGFSGWNLFGTFGGIMKEQGINLVNNSFFGPIVNAAQGVSSQISGGLQSFVNNITIPVRPQVVQSYALGDIRRMMSLTYSISKLSSCCLLMMAIPVALEIDYILKLWLGDNVPEHTNTFTIIILITTLVNNLNSATSGIVHATGVMKYYQLFGSVINIISVPVAYFLLKVNAIPEMAYICVLFGTVASHTVGLFVVRSLVGMTISEYYKEVVMPIIIVLFFSMLTIYPIHFYMNYGILRLCVVTLTSILTVLVVSIYGALNRSERHLLTQLLTSYSCMVSNRIFHRK